MKRFVEDFLYDVSNAQIKSMMPDQTYQAANDKDALFRFCAVLALADIDTEQAKEELMQSAALDFSGEIRIAAILGLARKFKQKKLDYLQQKASKFNNEETKKAPLFVLAILKNYDMDKALDFQFDGKDSILHDIARSNYERSKAGVDRIAYFLTYFYGLDCGAGYSDMILKIVEKYPEYTELLNNILKWIPIAL